MNQSQGEPALIDGKVMYAILSLARESTDSFVRSQNNDFTLHEVLAASGPVYRAMKIDTQGQKDISRLIGTMSSDRTCPDWFEKLKKGSQYAAPFKHTDRPITFIPFTGKQGTSGRVEGSERMIRETSGSSTWRRRRSPRKKSNPSTPATPCSIPIPSVTLYSATAPHEKLDLVIVDNMRPPNENPETHSDEDDKGKSVSFTSPLTPTPLDRKKVPSTMIKSPFKSKSQPTYTQPKAPSRRRIQEMCHPTNFTHLRTCEACRLKAIAANVIPVSFPFERRSRSLSPLGLGRRRNPSNRRSLSPRGSSTYKPVVPRHTPSPEIEREIPVYTPMRDILALKKVSRKPMVHREGWVKAVLHWEKAVLRKLFDAWTTLPAISLVGKLNAVRLYTFTLQRKIFNHIFNHMVEKRKVRAQIQEAVTHWWVSFTRSHLRVWFHHVHKPLPIALTDWVEKCFSTCLLYLTSDPLALLNWCSQLHVGYKLSRLAMAEDTEMNIRIMTKYFDTASRVVFKCWQKYSAYCKRIRLFTEHQQKKRAIRTYIDFTFRRFRLRHKASKIQQCRNLRISVNSIMHWKLKLRGQLLLRNAAYLYVRSRARVSFLSWKRDIELCRASDMIKADVATKLAKKTLKTWVVVFFRHRAVSIVQGRAEKRLMQMLVKPAFEFLKSFRIKMIRFRFELMTRRKRSVWGHWQAFVGGKRAEKSRFLVADHFHYARSFKAFATTALRLSRWNSRVDVLLYKHRTSKCKAHFAFWNGISRRRGWWRRAGEKVANFYRTKNLSKVFKRLHTLSVVRKALRSEMTKQLRSFAKRRLLSLCFHPWRAFAVRSADINHKLSRVSTKRRYDTWWSILRFWRDFVRTRKETRRKGEFLTLRYEERVKKWSFMKYRTGFLWEQVFKEVVKKREELLLERCFVKFLGLVRKLRYGRKRAQLLFERSSTRFKTDVFKPWKSWYKRRKQACANGAKVHQRSEMLKKKEILKAWKSSLRWVLTLKSKDDEVRELIENKIKRDYLRMWNHERKLFARARVFNERMLSQKCVGIWKRYAVKRKARNTFYSKAGAFAAEKCKRRLFERLIKFTSDVIAEREMMSMSDIWHVEYNAKKGLRKLGASIRAANIGKYNEAKASYFFQSKKGKEGFDNWVAFLSRRKRLRSEKREVRAVLASRTVHIWSDRTRDSLRGKRLEAIASRHHEEKTKATFVTLLQILCFGRKTERVNMVTGEDFYDLKGMRFAMERFKENKRMRVLRREKSREDKKKGGIFFSIRVCGMAWRSWADYARYRRKVKKMKSKADLFFLQRIFSMWCEGLEDLEKGQNLFSMSLIHHEGALVAKCWDGFKRFVEDKRRMLLTASTFSDLQLVVGIWKRWKDLVHVAGLLRGVLGAAEERAMAAKTKRALERWAWVAARDQRFEIMVASLTSVSSKRLVLLAFESWKLFSEKGRRILELRTRVFSRVLSRVLEYWAGFVSSQRVLAAKMKSVEEASSVAILKRAVRNWVEALKAERVKKSREIRRRRVAFAVWKGLQEKAAAEKELIARMLAVFRKNPWCRKSLCKLYLLELGRSFLSLRAYTVFRKKKRSQSDAAVALYCRRVAEWMVKGWKEYVKECRCLRICDAWRGARMASIGIERWRVRMSSMKLERGLMDRGRGCWEEKVKEKFVSRWIEKTKYMIRCQDALKRGGEWWEWKGKVRSFRRLLVRKREKVGRRELTSMAWTHARKILLEGVLLKWARATGLITRAKVRARAMSASIEKRGLMVCFGEWKVVAGKRKRLRLKKEVVEKRSRRAMTKAGLEMWRKRRQGREKMRSFVLLLWAKLVLNKMRLGFKVLELNAGGMIEKERSAHDFMLARRNAMLVLVLGKWRESKDKNKALARIMWLRMKGIVLGRLLGRWIEWVDGKRRGVGLLTEGETWWEEKVLKGALARLKLNVGLRRVEATRLYVGESLSREKMMSGGLRTWETLWRKRKEWRRKKAGAESMRRREERRWVGKAFLEWLEVAKREKTERNMKVMSEMFMLSSLLKRVVRAWRGWVWRRLKIRKIGKGVEGESERKLAIRVFRFWFELERERRLGREAEVFRYFRVLRGVWGVWIEVATVLKGSRERSERADGYFLRKFVGRWRLGMKGRKKERRIR